MKRNISLLTDNTLDVLVIGGGIYGTAIAYEAATCGLKVALVEKGDFGNATSANSLKVIHGGLRYLQHGDWRRARQSIKERRTLLRIAPHLVQPLPVIIPTYGHGLRGRWAMAFGLKLNDCLSLDRNWEVPAANHLPPGYTMSRQECLARLPGINETGLTGAAFFWDAFIHNSERLPLVYVQSMVAQGGIVANYVEVIGAVRERGRVSQLNLVDHLSGQELSVRAKTIVNAAGPWNRSLQEILTGTSVEGQKGSSKWAKAFNLVTRPLFGDEAVGLVGQASYQDKDTLLATKGRFLFVVPWREYAMIGTEYIVHHDQDSTFTITESEIQRFLNEINHAYPRAALRLADVRFVQAGLIPITGSNSDLEVQLRKHSLVLNHASDGAVNCWTVVGVKYTTARAAAEQLVKQIVTMLGKGTLLSDTATKPLFGGSMGDVMAYADTLWQKQQFGISKTTINHMISQYGSACNGLMTYLPSDNPDNESQSILRARVRYAIHEEMAIHLEDILFRRTEWATAGHPGDPFIQAVADLMADELGWLPKQKEAEIARVTERLKQHYAYYGTKLAHPIIS